MRKICRIDDIPEGGAAGFENIIVIRTQDQVLGYLNSCPHTGVELNWGPNKFLSLDKKYIQCATHGALFAPETGLCIQGPCTGDRLTPVPLFVKEEEIYCDV